MISFTMKNGCSINFDETTKKITLLSGSKVKTPKDYQSAKLKDLFTNNVNKSNETTSDLSFDSLSGCAAFIEGKNTNGKAYFKKWISTGYVAKPKTSSKVATSTTTTTETEIETSENEEKEPKIVESSETENVNVAKEEKAELTTNKEPYSEDRMNLFNDINNICKDFYFKPNSRLLDTIARVDDRKNYIVNYLELFGYEPSNVEVAKSKMESAEWDDVCNRLKALKLQNEGVNKRLSIRYGSAGTGKTYDAIKTYPRAKVIVASESQSPDELFTRFSPQDKKYILTEMGEAMVNGEPIIIDEFNLYNMPCFRELQGITDNKKELESNGINIKIKDGFKIIATMNLHTLDGGECVIPEPLVSRAYELINYDLNASTQPKELTFIW